MKQRKISDLIKDLKKVQKEHGDLDIKVHLESLANAHAGEFSHDDLDLHVEHIEQHCPDTYKTIKKKWKVLSIFAGDYGPEDFGGKSLNKKLDIN
ncbi:hypothetical protein EKK58_08470 [Candidatus Dependentiae bacterium]|nr:MAG: hypothetical protein EKK58_08470 [Candidatus Dependentiae bacterium]